MAVMDRGEKRMAAQMTAFATQIKAESQKKDEEALLATKENEALLKQLEETQLELRGKKAEIQKIQQELKTAKDVVQDFVLSTAEKQHELDQAREKILSLSGPSGVLEAESQLTSTTETLRKTEKELLEARVRIVELSTEAVLARSFVRPKKAQPR